MTSGDTDPGSGPDAESSRRPGPFPQTHWGRLRRAGGKDVPPLPLPATSLRRPERKGQPAPPRLMTKLVWGDTAEFRYDNGIATRVADWNQCPADLQELLAKAAGPLGTCYGYETMSLGSFHFEPVRCPVLFITAPLKAAWPWGAPARCGTPALAPNGGEQHPVGSASWRFAGRTLLLSAHQPLVEWPDQ